MASFQDAAARVPWPKPVLIPTWPLVRSGHPQAALGVFQHGLNLLASNTGKPCQEIVHCGAVFETKRIFGERVFPNLVLLERQEEAI